MTQLELVRLKGVLIVIAWSLAKSRGVHVPRGMLAAGLRLYHYGSLHKKQPARIERWRDWGRKHAKNKSLSSVFWDLNLTQISVSTYPFNAWLSDLLVKLAANHYATTGQGRVEAFGVGTTVDFHKWCTRQVNEAWHSLFIELSESLPVDWRPLEAIAEDTYAM